MTRVQVVTSLAGLMGRTISDLPAEVHPTSSITQSLDEVDGVIFRRAIRRAEGDLAIASAIRTWVQGAYDSRTMRKHRPPAKLAGVAC
jgi:hypothetical protein